MENTEEHEHSHEGAIPEAGSLWNLWKEVPARFTASVTVFARLKWQSAMVPITNGDNIRIIASSEHTWRVNPQHGEAYGPDGKPGSVAPSGYVLPGYPEGTLCCQVGGGRIQHIGSNARFVAKCDGDLQFIANDHLTAAPPIGFSDNSGSIKVNVEVTGKPFNPDEEMAANKILARLKWQQIGWHLTRGTIVDVVGRGRWKVNPAHNPYGPDGRENSPAPSGYVITEIPEGSLCARIGQGSPFHIGKQTRFVADRDGDMFFIANDHLSASPPDGFHDNEGYVFVTVRRRKE